MRYLLCFLLLLLANISIRSQGNAKLFRRLNTSAGLSQNWVRQIYQDDIGFLWFGTSDGLNRYDGKVFKIYRPRTTNKKEIGDINVSAIEKKSSDELWVGTDLGLYVYSYKKDDLEPYTDVKFQTITSILQGKDNMVWFGTNNGLAKLDLKTNKLITYLHDPNDRTSIPNNFINVIFEDTHANIFIGTKEGLSIFDSKAKRFKDFKISGLPAKNFTNDILSICEDHNQRIWVGYSQDGLYYFPNKEASDHLAFTKLYQGVVMTLLVDAQNRLWVGKGNDQGLDVIDLSKLKRNATPEIEHIYNDPLDNKSLSDNSVYSLYQDNLKDIWIGTFSKGINHYSERVKKFRTRKAGSSKYTINHNLVNAIVGDDDNLYIGLDGGINILDRKTGQFSYYAHDPDNANSLSSSAIYALYKDSHGYVWIGTWLGGVNKFNPKTKTFTRYKPDGLPGSISNANVFSMLEDSRGNLWVGTIGGGLCRYSYETDKFTCYKHNSNDSTSLIYNMINCIYETHDGKLLISTFNSLELFDYEHETFMHYKHNYTDPAGNFGNITSLFEDSNHHIWCATTCGLESFDREKHTFTPYTTTDGLPDNTVKAILEDGHKNLWISTNKGISAFLNGAARPANPVFYNYTQDDGLACDESKSRAAFKDKDGTMYFGSSDGYTFFHPDSIKPNTLPPKVIITGFSFLRAGAGENIAASSGCYALNQTDTVSISYKQADFSIQFAALNYLNPKNNRFRYMLAGYDKDWVEAGNQQSAAYTNIHPGTYVFMVTASNNDNIWNKNPKTLVIVIHPPWWKTFLFKAILLLFIIAGIVLIFRIRFKVLENQKKHLEEIVRQRTNELVHVNRELEQRQEEITMQNEELSKHRYRLEELVEERTTELEASKIKAEESDKLKSAFLANMSHEIRTPMNAIVGFASLIGEKKLNPENQKLYIDIIKNNCATLLVLIDDILDISLIEANQLVFNKQTFNVSEVLSELESFYQMKNKNDLDIKFVKDRDLYLNHDSVRFRQIYNNLLDNAMKYTEKGHIWFGYQVKDTEIQFYVTDTGIGINAADRENIFNHFFKIEKESLKLYRGVGIGLSICKEIIALMGGRIWVESTENVGSTFYFTLPVDAGTDSTTE